MLHSPNMLILLVNQRPADLKTELGQKYKSFLNLCPDILSTLDLVHPWAGNTYIW